jgi:hypothetical protein
MSTPIKKGGLSCEYAEFKLMVILVAVDKEELYVPKELGNVEATFATSRFPPLSGTFSTP